MQAMFEAAASGSRTDEIEGVEWSSGPALTAAAADVLEADGYLLGTPANIGYMSGALKHFFDGIYYPCLEATRRRPYGLYVHGGMDTGGAVRAVESSPPACSGGRSGRQSRHRDPRKAGPASLLGTWRAARGQDRGLTIFEYEY